MNDNQISVVAVCGREARIYAPLPPDGGVRRLLGVKQFSTYGAARLFAQEFEDSERGTVARRSRGQ